MFVSMFALLYVIDIMGHLIWYPESMISKFHICTVVKFWLFLK